MYPKRYPRTICIYENILAPTSPGTEIKVTPDNEAPIMPKATIYQGDFLLPRKKVVLLAVLPVIAEIIRRAVKYIEIITNSLAGDIC